MKLALKKITLIQKFSILSLLAVFIIGIGFGKIVSSALEHNMLKRAKQITAGFVSGEVKKELTEDYLIGIPYSDLSVKVRHLNLGQGVEGIKIWNKNQVVVWADQVELVGRGFPDNEELNQALRGETVSSIATREQLELKYKFQDNFQRALELYIPIRFEPKGRVEAVFEMYQNIDPLYVDIDQMKYIVWLATIALFTILYTILVGIVIRISRRFETQTKENVSSE